MSPELRLATACCRYRRDAATQDAIAAALAGPVDWRGFDAVVQRHRIAGLAASALCTDAVEIPDDARARLSAAARRYAAQDLVHAAETARLQQLFDDAGIPAMFLKGVAVGVLAFGRLGIKQSWDIDLLTTEACMMPALELLERSGYGLVEPADLPRDALPRFRRFCHEAELRNAGGTSVELHWRLFSKPVLTGIDGAAETQTVAVAGRPVRTLREDLLIAYLIAHGQEHGWSRLKWLADLNALLEQKNAAELTALHARMESLGLAAKASAALLLCAELFALPLPGPLEAALAQDRAARRLADVSLDCIAHPLSGMTMPLLSRTSLALMTSRFGPQSGWRALAGEFEAIWTQPRERARYPAGFDFLYHLLRVPVWLLRLPIKLGELRRAKPSTAPGGEC